MENHTKSFKEMKDYYN
jgi:growth arrest-specific protein 8